MGSLVRLAQSTARDMQLGTWGNLLREELLCHELVNCPSKSIETCTPTPWDVVTPAASIPSLLYIALAFALTPIPPPVTTARSSRDATSEIMASA